MITKTTLGLLIFSTFTAAYGDLTSGLVAYYPFNGNVGDLSGYNNSSPSGSVSYATDRFGNSSSCAVFDGNNFLSYPNQPQLQFGSSATMCAWVKTQYHPTSGGLFGVVTKATQTQFVGAQLGIINSNYTGRVVAFAEPGDGNLYGPEIADNKWHSICLTRNGNTKVSKLYFDGSLAATNFNNGALLNNDVPLLIGNERMYSDIFVGSIDDVRIYNRALADTEVQQLYVIESEPNPIDEGLVVYLPFNGNANDESENGNNGTVSGAILTTNRFGIPNSAYYFGGNGSYISIPNSSSLHFTNAVTLSVWINFQEGGLDNPRIFTEPPGTVDLALQTPGPNPPLQFVVQPVGQVVATISANQWLYLAGTYDGQTIKLYTNGVVAVQKSATGNINRNTVPFSIGRNLDTGGDSFKGIIDDLRLFNRSLSQAEILQLFQEGTPCSPHRATATVVVVNGFVVGATITDGGCGYTEAPVVQIIGASGTGARAVATVSNGIVTGITISETGSGYSSTSKVLIASPPFAPWLDLEVSKVKVTQHVVLGKNYLLESSTDMNQWNPMGPKFTAQDEVITQEFDVDVVGRYFRIRQVP